MEPDNDNDNETALAIERGCKAKTSISPRELSRTLSSVLMVIVRWRAKAKLGAMRRRRIADAATIGAALPMETTTGVEMMRLQKRNVPTANRL
ncbi:unnamed protein product [Heligmosomoides polygyrus]|uniref:Uncharacterized protein n=1 Tax=Heligmosomoides polygyrus TaxID=6339 RepID=A0A183FZ59_HELPZ|nr:unnamed protein product [Heligmosomoides polygyrus]